MGTTGEGVGWDEDAVDGAGYSYGTGVGVVLLAGVTV
jgi:hypothetical protein